MEAALSPLIDRIRAAAAAGSPLRIRGGGTKDFYGESLQGELLDTTALAGITSYEPSELVVTVKAGTPLAVLETALAEKGQCLPFEPPHFRVGPQAGQATVGGMVAAGLSGPARATAGSVRDYVLGLSMVNGRAEHLTFGGQVMKNVAGYDVSRVMAGSWGTLGLITEVSLKVLPFAPAEATLRFDMDEGEAIRRVNQWAGDPLPLNASSWVVDDGRPALYLRLRGAVAAVEAACQRLVREGSGQRMDSAQTRADWSAARDLHLPWFTQGLARGDDLWRLSVPATTAALGVGDTLVEWLGAQRWVFAPANDPASATRLRSAARAAGGFATLFIASRADSARAGGRFEPLTSPLDRIHRQLKQAFDPAGIFNRGRLVAGL